MFPDRLFLIRVIEKKNLSFCSPKAHLPHNKKTLLKVEEWFELTFWCNILHVDLDINNSMICRSYMLAGIVSC